MRNMPFFGKIKGGLFQWKAKECFAGYCRLQKDGDYTLTLSKTVAGKTNEQLGYFHAVVVPVVFKQIWDDSGYYEDGKKRPPTVGIMIKDKLKEVPVTEQFVVDMLKQVWATSKGCEVKSKADMSIEECSELIDISIGWAKRYLSCNIPKAGETLI